MGINKRVSALLLAVFLSFGVCAVDYLKVDALEVGGSVVWDTAINYLLGLLGLSPIAENGDKIVDFDAMRSRWVQDYEAYFYANVQQEDLPEGYTKERAYQNWIDNVCRGNLNTIEYGAWDLFKEWAETLPSENSGGGSGGSVGTASIEDLILDRFPNITDIQNLSADVKAYVVNYSFYYGNTIDSFDSNYTYSFALQNGSYYMFSTSSSGRYLRISSGNANITSVSQLSISFIDRANSSYWLGSGNQTYFYNVSDLPDVSNAHIWEIGGDVVTPSDSDYAVVNDNISDLQIINDYSTTTTQNVVSIDWDKIGSMISDAVGTVTGSLDRTITDALDDAQEKVAAGSMSVANYNDYVTEISNTYVYDITNETSITNPDSTVTGVVSGNVENAEFVLKGLQYVFPFCIPWDIKDFVTLLVADPVAPVIEYPIYNPVTDTDEIITIDFSLWENQVRIIRYIFDFLLIIGLLLLARSLIGAGGSD